MNTSSSGSPNTPSSHVSFPYSSTATAATSINTQPSSMRATPPTAGPSPGKGQSQSATAAHPPTSSMLATPITQHKPRAQSTGQLNTHSHIQLPGRSHGVTPTFSPPYSVSNLSLGGPSNPSAGTAERPIRPTFSRRKTSASSGGQSAGKDEVLAAIGEGQPSKAGPKRASKACENCRLRRRKCSEQRPCKACVEIGLGASCVFRAKARPNRALPKVIDTSLSLDSLILDPPLQLPPSQTISPMGTGITHAHPVRDIDTLVELWLAEQGQPMSLRVYDPPSLLTDLSTRSLPPLLLPAAETHAVHSFLDSTARYFSFLHAPRLLEMLRLYHLSPPHMAFFANHNPTAGSGMTSPGGLRPDERAMVYAAICLGRFKEVPPTAGGGVQVTAPAHGNVRSERGLSLGSATGQRMDGGAYAQTTVPLSVRLREMREDSGYFCRALLELQNWGSASLTALGALHCLHLFTLLSGGAAEMRDILGRMVWQIRELGLHRLDSVKNFASEDRVERLFYTTLHEDNWFATLLDAPPFIHSNTYDPSLTPNWDREGIDGERWIDQHPCVVQLTMFENELLTAIHTMPELSQAYIFDVETRLADWMKVFREEQLAVPSWMLHTYANIRFQWLRIMLRAPLLSVPQFRLSSLATLCRAASQILLSYHSFSHTASFLPTWGECRRIITASHIVVLGHFEGEFAMLESEFLGGAALSLVEKLEGGCAFVTGAKARLLLMFGLLGIAPRKPQGLPQPEREVSMTQAVQQPQATPSYENFQQQQSSQQYTAPQAPAYQIHPTPQQQHQQQVHLPVQANSGSLAPSPHLTTAGLPQVEMGVLQHNFAPSHPQPTLDHATGMSYDMHQNQIQQHQHQQTHPQALGISPQHSAQHSLQPSPVPPHAQIPIDVNYDTSVMHGAPPPHPPAHTHAHTAHQYPGGHDMLGAHPLPLQVDTNVHRPGSAHSYIHHSAESQNSRGSDTLAPLVLPTPTPGADSTPMPQSIMHGGTGAGSGMGANLNLNSNQDVDPSGLGSGGMDEDADQQMGWLDPWLDAMLWTAGSDGNSVAGSLSKWGGQ